METPIKSRLQKKKNKEGTPACFFKSKLHSAYRRDCNDSCGFLRARTDAGHGHNAPRGCPDPADSRVLCYTSGRNNVP